MEEHGDAKLPDLLQALANCQKARSASIHDRCKRAKGSIGRSSRRCSDHAFIVERDQSPQEDGVSIQETFAFDFADELSADSWVMLRH
jgi:hypothetical protein